MNWNNAPDFESVKETHLKLGQLKARIKLLKTEIEIKTLDIKKDNPRKPYLIVEATQTEQTQLAKLESELETVEADCKFYDFWLQMFKQVSYNGSRAL